MPLPKPHKGQDRNSFINSCMQNKHIQNDFKNNMQRVAVCENLYRKHKKKSNANLDQNDPNWSDVDAEIVKDGAIILD